MVLAYLRMLLIGADSLRAALHPPPPPGFSSYFRRLAEQLRGRGSEALALRLLT